jgi:DNA-binding XRE family transcriptional regulator
MDLKIIGQNIKTIRLEMGLTQEGFAAKVNCSWRYIQFIEQGKKIPSLQWINKLSEELKIPINNLFQ